MRHELPKTVRIARIIDEAQGIKSFLLRVRLDAKPGQFVMVWLPGVDSKPAAVSYQDEEYTGVTVSAVGSWSAALLSRKVGDYLGLFGPYGNGFTLSGHKIVLLGGGYGIASLMLLAEEALCRRLDVTCIVGARTESKLLYRRRMADMGLNVIYVTDDGSYGVKGTAVDVLSGLLKAEKVDALYACGPELMEKRVAELCRENRIPAEISLERHMKCGFGVCGSCCLDPKGVRVCLEGPVFSAEKALSFTEFGKFHRDSSAAKHYF